MKPLSDQTVKLRRLQQNIRIRKGLLGCGRGFGVALHHSGRLLYAGSDRRGQGVSEYWEGITSICAEGDSVIALLSDGTIRAAGRSDAEISFADTLACVRRVDAGIKHIAVLLGNGRVIIGGQPHRGYEEAAEWPAVTDITCGADYTAGLTEDGRVLLAGGSRVLRYIVSAWRDVAGIFADGESETLYAINAAGRLLSSSPAMAAALSHKWRDLVFLAASGHRLRAVTASGQLLSTTSIPRQMAGRFYVACAVSSTHGLALTRDGLVLANGRDDFGQCRTARFGRMFDSFDEYAILRRNRESELEQTEQAYQRRYAESRRFGSYLACNARITACLTANGRVLTSAGFAGAAMWSEIRALACGRAHILALRRDGRVLADGNNVGHCCTVNDWRDVRAVAAGSYHSIGLTVDGHVLFRGRNDRGQGDVTAWTGIRYLRTTDAYTVGVGYDGSIVLAGTLPFEAATVAAFPSRPVDVAVADGHMACLYADGRVYSTTGSEAIAAWRNMRAIAVGSGFTVGLGYGGSVRVEPMLGSSLDAEACRQVSTWRHVVAVSCGESYIAALTADGQVLTAGAPLVSRVTDTELMSVHTPTPAPIAAPLSAAAGWQDVIAMACSPTHLIAINRDGQVLACGADSDGQCSVTTHFTLFRDAKYLPGYGRQRHADTHGKSEDTLETELPFASNEADRPTAPVETDAMPAALPIA